MLSSYLWDDTLAEEFAPQVPSESEEERERRMAHIEIEQILQAKGLLPPEDAPIELETLEEQESELRKPGQEESTQKIVPLRRPL